MDMSVDANGNSYTFCQLPPGIYGGSGGFVVSTIGDFILKYDANGNFKGAIPIDIFLEDENTSFVKMSYDEQNQKFYIAGEKNAAYAKSLRMGSVQVSNGIYIGSFDINGSFLWVKDNSKEIGIFSTRPLIDNAGNVYVCGEVHGENPTMTPPMGPDHFNGYEIKNGNGSATPFIMKMDKNGNSIWARDAIVNGGTGARSITLRNNDEVMIAGEYPGYVRWPGYNDTIRNKPPNEAYDVYITRFSTSDGSVRGMDWVTSTPGYNEFPSCMVGDGNGNVYIGGTMGGDMKVGVDNMVSTGGPTDCFLVKYGNMWPSNVNSFLSESKIHCYPNPAINSVYIDNAMDGSIQLTDITGRILKTCKMQTAHEIVDISTYPAGNYLLQLTEKNGERTTKKIVKAQ